MTEYPIKIRLSGKTRTFLTTALRTHVEDDDPLQVGYETTQRQKTNLVIKDDDEREALKHELEQWKDGRVDDHPELTRSMQNAMQRVYNELTEGRTHE